MCKALNEGGLRCSHHATKTLEAARAADEANSTPETQAKLKEALYDFHATPAGIKALREAGKEDEAQHFEAVRKVAQQQYRASQQAKEAESMRKELAGLYSPEGIEKLRESGEDDLADKLEERRQRIKALKARKVQPVPVPEESTDGNATPESNGKDDTASPAIKKPSLLAAAGKGAWEGGKAGFRSPQGNVLHAFNAGMSAGKGEAHKAQAQLDSQEREQERIRVTAEREQEKESKAYERDQERKKRERERQDRADAIWIRSLEAECIRYLKAQQREARKNSTSKHTAA
jgi:hypothetical protein